MVAADLFLMDRYRAAFLAEAEPQFVATPPAIARHYPPHLQRLGTRKALGWRKMLLVQKCWSCRTDCRFLCPKSSL